MPELFKVIPLYDTRMRSRKEHKHKICEYKNNVNQSERFRIVGGIVRYDPDKVGQTVSRDYGLHKSDLYAEEI